MKRRKKIILLYDSIQEGCIQANRRWVKVLKIHSFDMNYLGDTEQNGILYVFQELLRSIPDEFQIFFRRRPLDFSSSILRLSSQEISHYVLSQYRDSYIEYLQKTTKNKLTNDCYIAFPAPQNLDFEEAKVYLASITSTVTHILQRANIFVEEVSNQELASIIRIPDFTKEGVDYMVYGDAVFRTYIVTDYPREASFHWLQPLLRFYYPITITQHLSSFSRDIALKKLETIIAKLRSTIDLQEELGSTPYETKIQLKDAETILRRLASGEDKTMNFSFYVNIYADTKEMLDYRSRELEMCLRQCGLSFRRARKEMIYALPSTMPICNNQLKHCLTFDTKTISIMLPFTTGNFCDANGIVYGLSVDENEVISFDRWAMPNPITIILGKSGFGKSMLAKNVLAREIVSGVQGIVIDHNYEWKALCDILGGVYIDENCDISDSLWNHHLIVLRGDDKTMALQKVWNRIQATPQRKRSVVIEECHHVLKNDSRLLLSVVKEIRKTGAAPTLITQNAKDFLGEDEGQMIFDNCSIRIFLRQGENDLNALSNLCYLSDSERMFLYTCPVGKGYLYTDIARISFQSHYSEQEEMLLTTRPFKGGKYIDR